jgi:segregation and condensation protein B
MSHTATNSQPELKHILEAVLLAAGEPVSLSRMATLFDAKEAPSASDLSKALDELANDLQSRGIELKEVASGFRLKTRAELMPWISRLWEEKPQRYSRALLETLSLIAYRQPITRGEIEEVRGVSVSSNIIRTLQEREWIRVVGHRDVPGKPALFGTTRAFLDYFDLSSLDDLPTLAEIRDMANLEPEFDFDVSLASSAEAGDEGVVSEETAEAAVEIPDEALADDQGDDPDLDPAESSEDSDLEDEHERSL